MNVTVDLVNASGDSAIPDPRNFQAWAGLALATLTLENPEKSAGQQARHTPKATAELSIRVVDEEESAFLNSTYRHRQGPTNVLSFPGGGMLPDGLCLLGDLAICAPVVAREARAQHKNSEAHWAHMVIHGVLHLKGYDHEDSLDAQKMEELEIAILKSLGFANPYS
ncbi:MAG: rRNA maturation RNase YbeY [Pseudomonadales bacterium]|nr:rRNA maturation RNase YbeY [Pseudomonadales bacterium]